MKNSQFVAIELSIEPSAFADLESYLDFVSASTKKQRYTSLILSYITLKNGQTYFKNPAVFTLQSFIKYVWPFFNIMHERLNIFPVDTSLYVSAFLNSYVITTNSAGLYLFKVNSGNTKAMCETEQ